MSPARIPSDDELLKRGQHHLDESAKLMTAVAQQCVPKALAAAHCIADAFQSEHKLLLCGNGGSAADCQHMAAEFVSRLSKGRPRKALPAIALTTDSSFLTAYANDENFDGIFARQVEALGQKGDVLIGISTSGNSKNVIAAFAQAKKQGVKTIALVGEGGKMETLADIAIVVPSHDTQCAQESHLALEHCICDFVEHLMFGTM